MYPTKTLTRLGPILGLAALAARGPSPACAAADTFTVTVTGTITSIYLPSNPYPDPWGPGVQVGTPFTETFTWDRSIPATSIDTRRTRWTTQNIAQGADVTVGGVHVSPFQNTNQANASPELRSYWIQTAEANGAGAGKPPAIVFWSTAGLMTGADSRLFYDSTEMALDDPTNAATVSLTDPSLDWQNPALTGSEFNLFARDFSDRPYILSGTINSVNGRVLPTPEPSQAAGLALGALGLAGLWVRARRRLGHTAPDTERHRIGV